MLGKKKAFGTFDTLIMTTLETYNQVYSYLCVKVKKEMTQLQEHYNPFEKMYICG